MKKDYYSRIDFWVYLVIALPLVSLYPSVMAGDWLTVGVVGIVALFILSLLRTVYTIDDKALRVRCGFIPYPSMQVADIVSVRLTRSVFSSPALSLDRIAVTTLQGRQLVISPKERVDFVRQLLAINPNIKVDEELMWDN